MTALERLNPLWTPATDPLGPLAKFFGGSDPLAGLTGPSPQRPLTPAEAEAIEDVEHQSDLMGAQPSWFDLACAVVRANEREVA